MGIDVINDIGWEDIVRMMETSYNKESSFVEAFDGLLEFIGIDDKKKT